MLREILVNLNESFRLKGLRPNAMESIRDEISMFRADVTCLTHQVLRLLASLNIGHCACPACSQALVRLFVDLQDDAAGKNDNGALFHRALSSNCAERSDSGSREHTPLPCVDESMHNNNNNINNINNIANNATNTTTTTTKTTTNNNYNNSKLNNCILNSNGNTFHDSNEEKSPTGSAEHNLSGELPIRSMSRQGFNSDDDNSNMVIDTEADSHNINNNVFHKQTNEQLIQRSHSNPDTNFHDDDEAPSPDPILNLDSTIGNSSPGLFHGAVNSVVSNLFANGGFGGSLMAQLSDMAAGSNETGESTLAPMDKSLHRSVVASAAWKRRRASTADKVSLDVNQFKQSQGYCHICCKTVRQLRQHMLVHSGQKPYACRWCSRSFNDKSNRSKHVKQAHPDMMGSCHMAMEGKRGRPPRESTEAPPTFLQTNTLNMNSIKME